MTEQFPLYGWVIPTSDKHSQSGHTGERCVLDSAQQWRAALAADKEAAALYAWMAPSHQAEFLDWIEQTPVDRRQERISEALAMLRPERPDA
jgi:hypothetical protein